MTARRRLLIAVVVVVAAGAGAVLLADRMRADDTAPRAEPLPTTPVTKADLVTSVQQAGQLGYAGSYRLVGQRAGTVTAVPGAGQVIGHGQAVYAVDQRPIPLLFGTVPLYRPLAVGATGEDVQLLERNLVDLGYATAATLTVDTEYTGATASAVRRWQEARDLSETGAVDAGEAVVAPGPVRITSVAPEVGATTGPGEVVAEATGTGHGVRMDLDRRHQTLVAVGTPVRIQLFGGRAIDGNVIAVAPAAEATDEAASRGDEPSGQGAVGRQTIAVDIVITSPESTLGGVFEGPVTVVLTGETRRDVLSVPLEALTLAGNGDYAVVVVDRRGRRVVPVTTGLITSNRVEIAGAGIVEGTRVEVPAR